MIELPESHVLAEQIKKTLTGKRISDVIANHSPHGFAWLSGDPADYPASFDRQDCDRSPHMERQRADRGG